MATVRSQIESIEQARSKVAGQLAYYDAQGVDPDIQVTIDRDLSTAITCNSRSYIRHLYFVRLDVPDQTQIVNADNF